MDIIRVQVNSLSASQRPHGAGTRTERTVPAKQKVPRTHTRRPLPATPPRSPGDPQDSRCCPFASAQTRSRPPAPAGSPRGTCGCAWAVVTRPWGPRAQRARGLSSLMPLTTIRWFQTRILRNCAAVSGRVRASAANTAAYLFRTRGALWRVFLVFCFHSLLARPIPVCPCPHPRLPGAAGICALSRRFPCNRTFSWFRVNLSRTMAAPENDCSEPPASCLLKLPQSVSSLWGGQHPGAQNTGR